MPSFGGALIFGQAVRMVAEDRPRTTQENVFFGLSGVESLDGGLHGRVVTASGLLLADSPDGLAGLENIFRSFNDGVARELVDTLNNVFPYAILKTFRPEGKVRSDPNGFWYRPYTAMFHILT